jgi:hypothetical protein
MMLAAAAGMLTLAAAGCAPSGNSESSAAPAAVNAPETPPPAPMGGGESGGAMAGGGGMAAGGGESEPAGDSAAEKKLADLEAKLAKAPEDAKLKKEVAAAAYDAGHYIEYDKPGLMPRQKYRPALKLYNRALELDPKHEKAAFEKKQIEDIYQQMGMPIPK